MGMYDDQKTNRIAGNKNEGIAELGIKQACGTEGHKYFNDKMYGNHRHTCSKKYIRDQPMPLFT